MSETAGAVGTSFVISAVFGKRPYTGHATVAFYRLPFDGP